MIKTQYSFEEFALSSQLIRDLIDEKVDVKPFVRDYFSKANLLSSLNQRRFGDESRQVLVDVLTDQNNQIKLSAKTKDNIASLKSDRTFTITTGHQLNMATGPLYTIYKIVEVINWTEQLNAELGEHHFVPVFWMATEDHDFEEINHINLFGQKIEWIHDGVEKTVVGRLNTSSTTDFVSSILEKFGNEDLRAKIEQILDVYLKGQTLAEANRELINNLFGEYGLVIIDGDDSRLKKQFSSVLKAEIESGTTYEKVTEFNTLLSESNYHNQVFVRNCNLFYIHKNGLRERIEKVGDSYKIGEVNYSTEKLLSMVETQPEEFSPNALLRPVFQEVVLPNLAYIGGGGEIAYWLQLKGVFEALSIDFPLLKVRDSVVLVDKKNREILNGFGYSVLDLKMEQTALLKDFVTKNATEPVDLAAEKTDLDLIRTKILNKTSKIDKGVEHFIEGEFQRILNQFEKMEKKFIQAEKKNNEKAIRQLERLQHNFFPNNGFQERHNNIISYLQNEGIISKIKGELKQKMADQAAIHIIEIE